MMKRSILVLAMAAGLAFPAVANEAAINARKAQMTLFAFNLGTLGGHGAGPHPL